MALKECPRCNVMNRASAKRCRCGLEFDPSTLVKKATTRCPLCGLVAAGGAASCDCGYDFSTPAHEVRGQLVRRKRHGWFWISGGILIVLVVGVGITFAISILGGVLVTACGAGMIARGIRAISWAGGELADLDARDKALPEARVIER